jgi:hypothetical protein
MADWVVEFENKVRANLFGSHDAGLVIPYRSGVIYEQHTGAMRMSRDFLEGFYVPVSWPDTLQAVKVVFCAAGQWCGTLKTIDGGPDKIDAALALDAPDDCKVTVDRSKLSRSRDAWLWVAFHGQFWLVEDMELTEAVFTWRTGDPDPDP